jgi:glycosyltransferase involved in cell wall biosynthesis
MPKPKVLFEAGPMVDVKKTGVGFYVSRLITSLGSHYGDKLELNGYYFDFLHHNHKEPPAIDGVSFSAISLVPGKLLSLFRRLGLQPFLEFFTTKSSDIVFFTNYVALPLLRKRKMALAIYDLSYLDMPQYTQAVNLLFMQRFCSRSIRRADLIITISEFTKERLLHHFPDLQAKIVITPIPPDEIKITSDGILNERLTSLGITPHSYLLFISTLEPRKNVQNLVKAYAELPADIRDKYALVLSGGKGWKDEGILAEIVSQQAKGLNIITTGYISEEEKHALYTNASVFVMPSHYEGFGMPILESMQYNLPVACSDIAVFHEAAGEAAVYFDKNSPAAIAETLTNLLGDQTLQQKLIASGQQQVTAFDWSQNATIVYNAFTELTKTSNDGAL